MRICVVLVAVAACGKDPGPPPAGSRASASRPAITGAPSPADAAGGAGVTCEPLPFADSTPLPEASGAAWLELDGVLGLVVVGDSNTNGAFVVLDPDTGATRSQGALPLGTGAGDDLEGLAAHGDTLYGLTSAGQMRTWRWQRGGFHLVDGPYPIGTGDDVCKDPLRSNCARDYEGLAIAPMRAEDADACAGFACSRANGTLYCLVEREGRLQVDRSRTIRVERSKVLADCAFSDRGELFTGNNLFGLSTVHRIDGWQTPATAEVSEITQLGTGFPEVVAARGDVIYRLSDTGGPSPSLMTKFRCQAPAK